MAMDKQKVSPAHLDIWPGIICNWSLSSSLSSWKNYTAAWCFHLWVKWFDFFLWALLRLSLLVFLPGVVFFFLLLPQGSSPSLFFFFFNFFFLNRLKVGIAKNLHMLLLTFILIIPYPLILVKHSYPLGKLICCLLASANGLLS